MRWYNTSADVDPAVALAAVIAGASGVLAAIAAATNCEVSSFTGPAGSNPSAIAYGTNAQYKDCEDKASLLFQTGVGGLHHFQIPAPKVAVFLADQETVDPSNGLVTAVVSAMTDGTTCDRNANLLTGFIGGGYLRRRTIRRFNTITKNPALTGPGL